jgi:AraC-like DNA-binding protein
MDVLTDVLDALRLKSTLYCRSRLGAPWRLRFEPTPCATFHVVLEGAGWLHLDGTTEAVAVAVGDVLMLPSGCGHELYDAPDSPAMISIQLDQYPAECLIENWAQPHETAATLLCGTFELEHDNGHPFLTLLPPLIHLRGHEGRSTDAVEALLAMMACEVQSGLPGAQTLLRRLADMLFIHIIRAWIEDNRDGTHGWLAALRDAQIGAALSMMHQDLATGWTVGSLATHVAMSRSAFAERFSALVGEAPLRYLTRWRMHTAAHLLVAQQLPLTEVAARVGYESEFAFSKAFKRQYDVPPGKYRKMLKQLPHG